MDARGLVRPSATLASAAEPPYVVRRPGLTPQDQWMPVDSPAHRQPLRRLPNHRMLFLWTRVQVAEPPMLFGVQV